MSNEETKPLHKSLTVQGAVALALTPLALTLLNSLGVAPEVAEPIAQALLAAAVGMIAIGFRKKMGGLK